MDLHPQRAARVRNRQLLAAEHVLKLSGEFLSRDADNISPDATLELAHIIKSARDAVPGVELDAQGAIVRYDFEQQCHAVFQNVRYILEEAGAQWDDLVDVTVFLTNMKDDFSVYNRLYAEYFATAQPCRTTLEINALPTPIAIELKCIAVLRD